MLNAVLFNFVAFGLVVGGILVLHHFGWTREDEDSLTPSSTWIALAEKFDGQAVRARSGHYLEGTVRGLSLEVREETTTDDDGHRTTLVTLTVLGPFALRATTVGQPSFWNADLFGRSSHAPTSLVTGDPHLDREVRIEGNERHCLALLDEKTRLSVRRLFALETARCRIDRSLISVALDGRGQDSRLVTTIEAIADVAEGIRCLSTSNVTARLYSNVRSERELAVRRRCLETILQGGEATTRTELSLREVETTGDAAARLLAAMASGAGSHEAVAGFASDRSLDPELRRSALDWLGAVARDASRWRLPDAETRWIVACTAWRGRLGDPRDESFLLPLLEHESRVLRLATARALANVGGRASVAPLLVMSRRRLESRELRSAALASLQTIQARLHGSRGSVSLDDSTERGTLSPPIENARALELLPGPRDGVCTPRLLLR